MKYPLWQVFYVLSCIERNTRPAIIIGSFCVPIQLKHQIVMIWEINRSLFHFKHTIHPSSRGILSRTKLDLKWDFKQRLFSWCYQWWGDKLKLGFYKNGEGGGGGAPKKSAVLFLCTWTLPNCNITSRSDRDWDLNMRLCHQIFSNNKNAFWMNVNLQYQCIDSTFNHVLIML